LTTIRKIETEKPFSFFIFRPGILATGGRDRIIKLWDMNSPSTASHLLLVHTTAPVGGDGSASGGGVVMRDGIDSAVYFPLLRG
jgi:hypothetical protein